ncbi:TetR/AcrR family transcriptional regulator [Paenibacillus tengchongensis]|uniref:TetR/AcrR family transcriptional regulator n=1 Tax=Paenibacillus tengchongensis TaxID=2608684 RepID=UPI00124EB890|nr:TetR/AcrR family transcriptional regulator [Paenibacillus tengchongensis]
MPRNPERDRQLRGERRQQILDAAARIFARKGLLAKISDIAAEAGLSHGHVYNSFKSKEELLLAVIEQGQHSYEDKLRTAIEMEGTAKDKFRYLAELSLPREGSADSYLVLLQALSTDLLSDGDKAVIRARGRVNKELLRTLIIEGQQDGTVMQGDPVQLMSLFATLIQNLMLLEMRMHEKPDETTIELLLRMIGP